jgi:hypothetical protein
MVQLQVNLAIVQWDDGAVLPRRGMIPGGRRAAKAG